MNKLEIIKAIPKTIFFNLKYLPLKQAIKLPIIVSNNVKILKKEGKIKIESKNIKLGIIKIGFGNVGIFDKKYSRTLLEIDGEVAFGENVDLGYGSKISVHGILRLGDNVSITANSSIICCKEIIIGKGCMISWDNLIMDTDFHTISDSDNNKINENEPIILGNDVWIGCRCTILKGTHINDGCIVAAGSTVSKVKSKKNSIIGDKGVIIKENVFWKR